MAKLKKMQELDLVPKCKMPWEVFLLKVEKEGGYMRMRSSVQFGSSNSQSLTASPLCESHQMMT